MNSILFRSYVSTVTKHSSLRTCSFFLWILPILLSSSFSFTGYAIPLEYLITFVHFSIILFLRLSNITPRTSLNIWYHTHISYYYNSNYIACEGSCQGCRIISTHGNPQLCPLTSLYRPAIVTMEPESTGQR